MVVIHQVADLYCWGEEDDRLNEASRQDEGEKKSFSPLFESQEGKFSAKEGYRNEKSEVERNEEEAFQDKLRSQDPEDEGDEDRKRNSEKEKRELKGTGKPGEGIEDQDEEEDDEWGKKMGCFGHEERRGRDELYPDEVHRYSQISRSSGVGYYPDGELSLSLSFWDEETPRGISFRLLGEFPDEPSIDIYLCPGGGIYLPCGVYLDKQGSSVVLDGETDFGIAECPAEADVVLFLHRFPEPAYSLLEEGTHMSGVRSFCLI